ncbi:MAG: alpha-hydroxy acid oxidase [Gammaproteobacteria bacterium]
MTTDIFCVEDARAAARRRMPRMVFDFVDGAAGAENLTRLNAELIDQIRLQPRVLVNVENRSLTKSFLGRDWGLPFGVAPMGMCDLAWPGADKMLATAASRHNIPLSLSTAASSTIEDMRQRAGDNAWFQFYVGQSKDMALDFVRRADNAGYQVLLFTVDVPQLSPRLRDLRNGFKTPIKIGARQFLDLARHPRWSISTLFSGVPRTVNYAADGTTAFVRGESRGRADWDFLGKLRNLWPRTLIVKGVLSPADAVRIRDAGVDAVYVSNHGGRQLDSAPPAIQMLPLIRVAVGNDYPLLFDSGIRNGEGVIKALALGANFVMLGRPFLYGIGAAGERGLEKVIDILTDEISLTLAQLGRPDIEGIDRTVIAGQIPGLFSYENLSGQPN